MVMAAMNGTAHRLLEAKAAERELGTLREELVKMLQAYLAGCLGTR